MSAPAFLPPDDSIEHPRGFIAAETAHVTALADCPTSQEYG